ncbi:MAG: peptidylprolyl isomerase [Cytophagales bacterium]|nr:peptidylprolyl isomerase [Cytophagales bacterium]
MKKNLIQTLLTTALIAVSGVAAAQNIAIVNGKAVPKTRLDVILTNSAAQAKAQNQQLPPNFEAQVKERLITLEIFSQEAMKRGLDRSDSYKMQVEMARQSALANALLEDEIKKAAPSDAAIQAEYDKYVKENGGKEYKARHILVETEDGAKAIIAQLKKGAEFAVLARKDSKDSGSGANGGELEWAGAGNFVKEFSDGMVKLSKGQLTETPVKTQFGYHIIRLDDVRDAKLVTLEQAKPEIKKQLEQQKLAKFQDDLRKSAKVE